MTSSDRWRRIEEVFQAAVDLPREDRYACLHAMCGEDEDLRREVESLLARDDSATSAISSIIEDTAASLFDDDAPPDAMAGAELGSYRIIQEIGRGGMGAVYLAVRADRAFEKQVAIKLVKRGIDTDAVLQRFWYERRILAALEHPFIARLIDGGTSPDGRPYFVMEYVDGKPLDIYARERAFSIPECCVLFRKICEAVSYAHRNLIIHRDLKPANILVASDGTPKLLDFGIARLLNIDPGENTIASLVNTRALTPEFASPEQARGEAVTTATDVYSLGAVLRAMLPPGTSLPSDLATIISKATREESDQRFASVAELSEDVRRFLEGLPIAAREQTLTYRAAKFVRRHRAGVAVLGLSVLVGITGIAAIVWESRRADQQRQQAEQRLSQAVGMAEQTLKDVNDSLASLPGATEARRQMVRNTLDYLNRLSIDSGEDARVLIALATAYVRVGEVLGNSDFPNLGDLPGSLATYERAIDLMRPVLAVDPGNVRVQILVCAAHQGRGNILESLGRDKEAEAEYRSAIGIADKALSVKPDDPGAQYQSLDAHYALDFLHYTGHAEEAEKDMRQQLPVAVKLAALQPQDLNAQNKLSEVYALIGTCLNRMNKLADSLVYYRKAAEVREGIYRRNPRNTRFQRSLMIGYGHIGDVLGNPFTGCLADYSGALEYFEKAAQIAEDMNRADPLDKRARFDVAMIWTRIGATRQAAGDPKRSNEALDRAIPEFESLMAGGSENSGYLHGIAIAYEFRARNMWLLGNRHAALLWYQKSLELAAKRAGVVPPDLVARSQVIADKGPIANLLALQGDRAGAIALSGQLIQEAEALSRSYSGVHLARAWWWYGQTYETLNDFPAAANAYTKALEVWKKVPGMTAIPQYIAEYREVQRRAAACRKKL